MAVQGEIIEVRVDALDDRARGVGSHRERADDPSLRVTVPGIVPGEVARVRVTWRHKKLPLAHGRALDLVVADPARLDAPCPRHEDPLRTGSGKCSGCPLQSVSVARQHELKLARVRDELGIPIAGIESGPALEYRWSAKRVVGGRAGAIVLGSRRPRGHHVADMAGCLVDHPRIVEAAAELRAAANELAIEPHRPATPDRAATGDLRYVWFKTDGEHVLVTLIVGDEQTRAHALAGALKVPAGVALSVQPTEGNVIRGSAPTVLCGRETIEVSFPGLAGSVDVGPLGFLQPNPSMAGHAYAALVDELDDIEDDGRPVYDLYAGAGLTTHWLRRRFAAVEPCEVYPESAATLGIAPSTTAAFLRERVRTGAQPRVVVANPPRGGLGDEVCALLRELAPDQLRIMSCNPQTLARDLRALCAAGGTGESYRLTHARAYDTLPHTAHVEIVVQLVPVGGRGGDLAVGGFAARDGD